MIKRHLPFCFLIALFALSLTGCSESSSENTEHSQYQDQVLMQVDEPFEIDSDIINQLEALGYLGGHDRFEGRSGVTIYRKERCFTGYNLVVSGHAPVVTLITMDGDTVHTWECPRNKAFPDDPEGKASGKTKSFRRAYALENGDLIGIYNGTGMVRLSWNSDILWRQSAMCHHDLTFAPEERLYTFVQKKRIFEDFNAVDAVYDEFIVEMDASSGKILRTFSLLESFFNSRYASSLKKIPSSGDIFHANTIQYIDSQHENHRPIYLENHLLISLRNMDAIAILDAQSGIPAWLMTGFWSYQHEPSIMRNGNILLFDNTGHKGRSKVIEFDPLTQAVAWEYADSPETPLFSSTSGACHRLPNGNTLIIESNRGRAIEVQPDRECVWEFINPEQWGEQKDLIATLFDVQRLPLEFFDDDISCILNSRNSGTSHIH